MDSRFIGKFFPMEAGTYLNCRGESLLRWNPAGKASWNGHWWIRFPSWAWQPVV